MGLEEILKKNTPVEAFDRDKYVKYLGSFKDAREWVDQLNKNSSDYETRKKLAKLLFGDPRVADNLPLERLMDYGTNYVYDEKIAISEYARHNFDTLLDKMNDEEMTKLAFSLPAITNVDDEHDKIAKTLNEFRKMQKASESAEAMHSYVMEQAKKAPGWFKNAYSQSDAQVIFQLYATHFNKKLNGLFVDKDGKFDRNGAENFYRSNLVKVESKYDEETDEGARGDIMNDEVIPRYVAVAEVPYDRLKKEMKLDKDKPKEERKAERKKIGMAA